MTSMTYDRGGWLQVDAAGAVRALHESMRALTEAAVPVTRATGALDVLAAVNAGDRARALALGKVRACVSSMYEVAAHVLALGHLWDERYLPALAAERPVVTATSLTIVAPRDAWWRAVEALAFGSAHGNGALGVLRPAGDPVAAPLASLLSAAEALAEALAAVEAYLPGGVPPGQVTGAVTPAPRGPAPVTTPRRRPRWGPAGGTA